MVTLLQAGGIVENILYYKDFSAFIFGLTALILSVVALWQKTTEVERGLRNQATDVLSGLGSASIDLEKVRLEFNKAPAENKAHGELDKVKRTVHALACQADSLIKQIPYLVSEVEYANLALSFETVSDTLMAEAYWQKATATEPVKRPWYKRLSGRAPQASNTLNDKITRSVHLRRYGSFLHFQGKEREGDEKFESALELLRSSAEEQAIFESGFIYRKYAQSKLQNKRKNLSRADLDALQERCIDLVKNAAGRYRNLTTQRRVNDMKRELEGEIKQWRDDIPDAEKLIREINFIIESDPRA